MKNENEIRSLDCQFEVRSNDEGQEYIEGYALKFEQWSETMWDFQEIIDKDALRNTDLSDVKCLINHDSNFILARTSADNLELEVDGIGLKFRAFPSDTSYARDLKENMKVKNIDKCSFSFRLNWDNPECEKIEYDKDSGIYKRRLMDIKKISDVSVVVDPAYLSTEAVVAQRSLDKYKQEINQEIKKRKLKLELELL